MNIRTLLPLVLFAACQGGPQLNVQRVIAAFEPVADAVLRVKGYATLQKTLGKQADLVLPLIDKDGDKVITLAELRASIEQLVADPETTAALLAAAYLLRERG